MFPFEKNGMSGKQSGKSHEKLCGNGQIFSQRETKKSSQGAQFYTCAHVQLGTIYSSYMHHCDWDIQYLGQFSLGEMGSMKYLPL